MGDLKLWTSTLLVLIFARLNVRSLHDFQIIAKKVFPKIDHAKFSSLLYNSLLINGNTTFLHSYLFPVLILDVITLHLNQCHLVPRRGFKSREIYWYYVLAKISNNKELRLVIESTSNSPGQEQVYNDKGQNYL